MTEIAREHAIAKFVEQFALKLTEAGMARMPARVFALLLATDSGHLTATEMADGLRVSPAAISGAVRYLTGVDLVRRAREPGERRDHYEVAQDVWFEAYANREAQFTAWATVFADGAAVLGPDTPAGQRMAVSRRFFEFLRAELPTLMEKWREIEAKSP